MDDRPAASTWQQIRPLSPMRELAAISMFVKRDYLQQTHFVFAFLTAMVGTAFPLVIYGIIARLGQSDPATRSLAGGYVNFVISGLIINTLLGTALSGPYSSLLESFWSNRLEIILASPLRLPVFITGLSAGRYVDTAMRLLIYIVGGAALLGFSLPSVSGVLKSVAVVIPALAACTGLGLLAASSLYTLDARGGQDPVRLFVETASGLVAGVYFPVQMLPKWACLIAELLPHTYAIDGMRRALYGAGAVPLLPVHGVLPISPLLTDCLVLVVYSFVALPVGWKLFRHAIHLARKDGRLSRWA